MRVPVMSRGARWDVAFVAVAAVYAVSDAVLGLPSDAPGLRWALLGSAALAVGLVRRFPVTALVVEIVLFGATTVLVPVATPLSVMAVVFALASVAHRHRWPVTVAAAVVVYALALLTVASSGLALLSGLVGVVRALGLAMAVASPVVCGRYVRGIRTAALLAEQRAEEAERRRVAEAEAARLAERARIAGDLHDIVAHHVSAIALRAGTGHYAAAYGGDQGSRLDAAAEALLAVRDSAGQALVELRGLLQVLRDPSAVPADTPAVEPETMITDAVRRSRDAGLTVEAHVDSRTAQAPLAVRLTAARAVQEALTNALKHAGPGAEVVTRVTVDGDALRVRVSDSGSAGRRTALPASGHGLSAMRERVALIGGTLATGPAGPRGWRVDVSLPLRVDP